MFFSKQKFTSDILFKDFIDIHCHLLPGIDDGSPNLEQSQKMIDDYVALGIQKVIATPHVFKELYPNTPTTIKDSFDLLMQHLEVPDTFSIKFSAEYMIDEDFIKKLNSNAAFLHFFNNYLLIEIMPYASISILDAVVFQLQTRDIIPILAHPERYFHADASIENFKVLKANGVLFQLNALALMGHYGKTVYDNAKTLLKENMYDFAATDAHHSGHLTKLKKLILNKHDFKKWDLIKENQLRFFNFI